MDSAPDFRLKGPGSSPGQGHLCCVLYSWARYLTLTVLLSAQEYEWVPANCQGYLTKLKGYLRWTSIPSRGSSNTPSE